MIVGLNNEILQNVLPVEAPLLKPYMDQFDSAIEPGVSLLCWESGGVEEYIQKAEDIMKETHSIFQVCSHTPTHAPSMQSLTLNLLAHPHLPLARH